MKRYLEIYINRILRDEMKLLFGEGSYISVNNIKISTNNKTLVIDVVLNTPEPELCLETYPLGLEVMIHNGVRYSGVKKKITLITSLNLI